MKRSEGHYNKSERAGSRGYDKDDGIGLLDRLRSLFSSSDDSASSPQTREPSVPSSPTQETSVPSSLTQDTPAPNTPTQEASVTSSQDQEAFYHQEEGPGPTPQLEQTSQPEDTFQPWELCVHDAQDDEDSDTTPPPQEVFAHKPESWEDFDTKPEVSNTVGNERWKTVLIEVLDKIPSHRVGPIEMMFRICVGVAILVGGALSTYITQQNKKERQRIEMLQEQERERIRQMYQEHREKERKRMELNKEIVERNNLRPKPKTSSNPIKYLSSNSDISASEYAYCRNLREVELECRHIGSKAFLSCSALEEVIAERNLTQVDSRAFADCKRLSTVLFPHTLRKIGSNIFEDSRNIREASLPYGVREQLGEQIGDMGAINTLYVLTDRFYKMPKGLKEGNLHRPSARLYVPDALLADFCKDTEWILFNEILPLSQSRWYDARGRYKR